MALPLIPLVLLALTGASGAFPAVAPAGGGPGLPVDDPRSAATLHGVVTSEGYRTDGLVPGAMIELRQGGAVRITVSDTSGRYRFPGVEGGEARVRVSHVATHGFETTVLLPSSGDFSLDITLEARVLRIVGLGVRSAPGVLAPTEVLRASSRARSTVAMRGLDASSGMVESGLTRFTSASRDGAGEPDRDRVLFTRGSTVDARMVLLDGAPILTPFHVAGLVPAFDGSLLGGADLHLGGAPTRFDGGLSYLLDLRTRTPREDRTRVEGAVDGVSARGVVESGLPGGGSLLAGGRILHGLQNRIFQDGGFPYDYGDLLVRTEFRSGESRSLRITGYMNREGVTLGLEGPGASASTDTGMTVAPGTSTPLQQGASTGSGIDAARWGNRAISARFLQEGERAHVEATVAGSRYESSVPLLWQELLLAHGRSDRLRAALDLRVPRGESELRFGVSSERIEMGYRLEASTLSSTLHPEDEEAITSSMVGGYAEWEGEVTSSFLVRAGLRGDRYFEADRTVFAPRLSMRFLLTDRAHLILSAGKHHQAVPAPRLAGSTPENEAPRIGWSPMMEVASATHLVVGLEQEMEGGTRLDISGFMKRFSGFESAGAQGLRASGTDLRVARNGERVDAWFGYALTWFWEDRGSEGSDRFEGRQLLSAGANGRLADGWELGLTVGYGAGLPLSAVDMAVSDPSIPEVNGVRNFSSENEVRTIAAASGGPLEVAREDDFLRVDLELSWALHPEVGGRVTELRPYLRVLNALDQRDALFHYFDRWRDDGVRPVANRPILPLFGVEWRF